ncbi:MAG TPA: DUF167 domain-containing protein [Chloroflexia bacterium]|nr:DUF167 domain-containing protein [Chloroflexia bacterium]
MTSDKSDGPIQATPGGVTVKVIVAPRSPANKVVGEHNGAIKVALTAPPVEGAANKSRVEFLAKLLGVPRSSVTLVSGETSRQKMVKVLGVSMEQVIEKLAGDETAKTPRTPSLRMVRRRDAEDAKVRRD